MTLFKLLPATFMSHGHAVGVGVAAHVANQRGKFELNCPSATATVLSNEMIQSAIANPRWAPPERAEYTVGVSGCNKRATYLVVCAVGGTGCVAVGARNEVQQ